MAIEVIGRSWNTREELLLGGAVLRHGTQDWHIVAEELQIRIPYIFTPQACKAKYEDLKERYSGCPALFEELRKKRIAELKRALEFSENSIGFLESKIKSLKAENNEKERDHSGGHDNNNINAPSSKLEAVKSSTKEDTSRDGLSAGSFTHEIRRNWSAEDQGTSETKPEVRSCDDQYEKASNVEDSSAYCPPYYIGQFRWNTMKKNKRGKRKRKDYSRNINLSETSVGDSEFLLDSSVDHVVVSGCKENSTSNNCGAEDQSSRNDGVEYLLTILDSIMENKVASVFRHCLDSQKRGRYKKMIRRHVDFDSIRDRVNTQTIKSTRELFVDLLLLTNNALVFYSKTTREYKYALMLRDLVTKKLNPQNFIVRSSVPTQKDANVSGRMHNASPGRPRSVRPGNRRTVASRIDGRSNSTSGVPLGAKRLPGKLKCNSSPPSVKSSIVKRKKKGIGRRKSVERGISGQRPAMAVKGKKRVRGN